MDQEREQELRETRFPKNVLQIGNVSDTPKIYMEDYVNTFLNHISESTQEEPVGAFLIGHMAQQDEQECVYITGAVRMDEVEVKGQDIAIGSGTWEKGREARQAYFPDEELIGWFLILPGRPLVLNSNLIKIHEDNFPSPNTVLILGDALDKEEAFFVRKYGDLMHMGGHYIYYEKNLPMQNYMISSRKQNCVSPGEAVEDHAAKEFRGIVRERLAYQQHRRSSRGWYAACALLALVVVVMGVTTVHNYDRMRSVQSSLDDIRATVAGGSGEEAVPTSGVIVSGTKEGEPGGQPGASVVGEDAEENDKSSDDKSSGGSGGTEAGGAAQTDAAGKTDSGGSSGGTGGGTSSGTGADGSSGDSSGDKTSSGTNGGGGSSTGQSGGGAGDSSGSDKAVSTIESMSENVYTVRDGDTLARISLKMYGDIGHVDAICRMNGLSDGNLIFIGQKLLLP